MKSPFERLGIFYFPQAFTYYFKFFYDLHKQKKSQKPSWNLGFLFLRITLLMLQKELQKRMTCYHLSFGILQLHPL